jgi:DNA repair protein SbcC/Rad50
MRPLRLDVEGFTCYRERQQVLDFSAMSLFAIAGPTGAGKSSILDTMLYALYGVVPRVGKQAIGEFISHGRDSMSVCLDFRVSGRDYRVTRRVKRPTKGPLKTSATLAELIGGQEKGLADNVKPVNDAVAQVLGLGYDEFIQTVVLPQGDFAKFLKASPMDQRAILQHLLRHDVFMRMRDEAERRRRQFAGQMDVIDGKLTTYEGATAEALAALDSALAQAGADLDAAAVARDAADAALADAQARHRLTAQVAELRTRQAALDAQAPTVEEAREQLARAHRAAPIAPLVASVRLASVALESATLARSETAAAADRAATARAQAASLAEAAALAARACPDVEQRIQALDEIAGDLTQRAELLNALAVLPARLAAAEQDAETARQGEAAARAAVSQAQARQQHLAAEHDATALDESLLVQLERVVPSVVEARAIHGEVLALDEEAERARVVHAAAQRAESVARKAQDTAGRARTKAAERAATARAAFEQGRVTHAAAALRAHLHEGDACPVCLQTVDTLPEVPVAAALAALEQAARRRASAKGPPSAPASRPRPRRLRHRRGSPRPPTRWPRYRASRRAAAPPGIRSSPRLPPRCPRCGPLPPAVRDAHRRAPRSPSRM